jgi:hypothetical protein
MLRASLGRSILGLTLAILSCGGEIYDPHGSHSCQMFYDSNWSSFSGSLVLVHNDTRVCPLEYAFGDPFEAEATIVDSLSAYPNAWTYYVRATYFDSYNSSSFYGISQLSNVFVEYFYWHDFSIRKVDIQTEYEASVTPDYLEFEVNLWSSPYTAVAAVQLEHCEETCS